MSLTQEELDTIKNVNLAFAKNYVNDAHYAQMTADREHYRLLAYLSSRMSNCTVYDIGTYRGLSAIALSANTTNQVVSYDIVDYVQCSKPDNVEFRIGDCYQDSELLKSPLISLDVDPHDGVFEPKFIQYLQDNNYHGILVLDDIHLNESMNNFWNQVTQTKFDLTEYGHYSGTGLVVF